jgi:RNA polymerase sigma factor (TIGR02999 family)
MRRPCPPSAFTSVLIPTSHSRRSTTCPALVDKGWVSQDGTRVFGERRRYNVTVSDVTRILSQIESGDPSAAEQLLPLVYDELRKLAAARLAQEKPGQTLQATALVHDAYLRLVDGQNAEHWDSRGHFFAAAAEAMRRILVDIARKKRSVKRGSEWARQGLDGLEVVLPEVPEDLLALDEALTRLAVIDQAAAQLVQLRFFAGVPLADIAKQLGVSGRTADRIWAYARAWLHREIHGG